MKKSNNNIIHKLDFCIININVNILYSLFVDREEYQMGSLSHYINCRAIGYQDLPQFPESPTDSSVRCVAVPEEPEEKPFKQKTDKTTANKNKTFYSDSDESNDDSEDDSDDSTDSSSDSSYEKIDSQVN